MTHRVIWKSLSQSYQDFLDQQQAERIEVDVSQYEQEEQEKYSMVGMPRLQTLLSTPLGLVSVNDSLSPFKHYDLWQFDTTRELTNEVVEKLKKVAGVEALKIITRFKSILAIGLAFQFKNVRPAIEAVLRDDIIILDDMTNIKVNKLKADLAKYSSWQILVQPNGELSFSYLEKDRSNKIKYEADKEKFSEVKKLSGAVLIERQDGLEQ